MVDELKQLMRRAEAAPWGKTCSSLWAEAALLAEELQDESAQIKCYNELVHAYGNGGEDTRAVAPFLWLSRRYQERPELFTDEDKFALAWGYKYIFSVCENVPTVSVAMYKEILDNMGQLYKQLGDPLQAYYIRYAIFYRGLGEREKEDYYFQKYLNAPHSELADCKDCVPGYEINYYRNRHDWVKTAAATDRYLATGASPCETQPEEILSATMEAWLRTGRDQEAWAAHIRSWRKQEANLLDIWEVERHLRYLALSGRAGRTERLERGLIFFRRFLPLYTTASTPDLLQHLTESAALLLESFTAARAAESFGCELPETIPWVKDKALSYPRQYCGKNPTVKQVANWCRKVTFDIAAQFDARPGHPNPGIHTAWAEKYLNPEPIEPLAPSGVVSDVSGLITVDNNQYALYNSAEATAGSHSTENPSCETEGQENPTDTNLSRSYSYLDLSSPWRLWDLRKLLQQAALIDRGSSSLHTQIIELLVRQPELGSTISTVELTKVEQKLWQQLQDIAHMWAGRQGGELPENEYPKSNAKIALAFAQDPREWEGKSTEEDSLHWLRQAWHFYQQHQYQQAAMAADKAMRLPSVDPLLVRLEALQILSQAAVKAGYPKESVEPVRQAVNISAAFGFDMLRVKITGLLVDVLLKNKRYVEAAEAASNALDQLTAYPQHKARHQLLLQLATALQRLDYDLAAAQQYENCAEAQIQRALIESPENAVKLRMESYDNLEKAAAAYSYERQYLRAYPIWRKLIDYYQAELGNEVELGKGQTDSPLGAKNREKLAHSYYSAAYSLAEGDGLVSHADMQTIEDLMDSLYQLYQSQAMLQRKKQGEKWYRADWYLDMGYLYWVADRQILAFDYTRQGIELFAELNIAEQQAKGYHNLARMHSLREEYSLAKENAQAALAVLVKAKKQFSEQAAELKAFLKELEE